MTSSAPDAALAPQPPVQRVTKVSSKQRMGVRTIFVRPMVPMALARLEELAYNLLWSWDPLIRGLFRRLDPTLWRITGNNPVLMLGRLQQSTLDRAASDPRFVALYRSASEHYDACKGTLSDVSARKLIAFFSMEYGLVECLPNYASGMGVVAGDFLKAMSDIGHSVVGIGLLYQRGYLQQRLNADGWQQEKYPVNDFYTLPLSSVFDACGNELKVSVNILGMPVYIKVWRLDVGRIPLYLLDTNVAENERPEDRAITDQIYFGDVHTRIRQEIVLGIGGLRALRAMGLDRTVYHMNEAHSAFLAIERVRLLMQDHGLTFAESLEASRATNVFTTHTPVPAGVDLFDAGLIHAYFADFCGEARIPLEQLMALGRRNPANDVEPFSMAVLAIKTSSYRIAVSLLHGWVARELWRDLWPELLLHEVPFLSITNGVHLPTWLNADLATVYDQYLQPDWLVHHDEPATWDLVQDIPAPELWESHRRRKRHLIAFVRERVTTSSVARKAAELRQMADVLDPDTFTIGFARRFATYKRATLLFRDVERLKRILLNKDMPVQIVIAGKAHPKDQPGKMLIREVVRLSRDPELWKHLVFVEDYDMNVAREMVQGVDLWLSNPRRGEEACGTSGMKAGINGVLNFGILDGWFDEAYEFSGGWAIGDREPYSDDQDEVHSSALYSLLEREIVPMYYSDREEGVPVQWLRRMRQSIINLSPRFSAARMAKEYVSRVYEPAQAAYSELSLDSFQQVREQARRNYELAEEWERVRIAEVESNSAGPVIAGQPMNFGLRSTLRIFNRQTLL